MSTLLSDFIKEKKQKNSINLIDMDHQKQNKKGYVRWDWGMRVRGGKGLERMQLWHKIRLYLGVWYESERWQGAWENATMK